MKSAETGVRCLDVCHNQEHMSVGTEMEPTPNMTKYDEKQAARQKRIIAGAERAANRAREKALSQLKVRTLTPTQYRAALKKLEIPVVRASDYFGISRRQAQRIASEGPVPRLVAKVIEFLLDGRLKKEDLQC